MPTDLGAALLMAWTFFAVAPATGEDDTEARPATAAQAAATDPAQLPQGEPASAIDVPRVIGTLRPRLHHVSAAAPSTATGLCPREAASAAHVCCDGRGGLTVCVGRPTGSLTLWSAVLEHERDHLVWFAENQPFACAGRAAGACEFQLTPVQRDDLECRGYRVEHRALARHLAGATGRVVGEILARQRTLLRQGAARFGCALGGESVVANRHRGHRRREQVVDE